ncbi:MAG: hypothetical protein AAF723_07360 [Pseudomonadota bacterium]
MFSVSRRYWGIYFSHVMLGMAFLVQTLIPHGYMLDGTATADGIVMQICSGRGETRTILFNLEDGSQTELPAQSAPSCPPAEHDQDQDQQPCLAMVSTLSLDSAALDTYIFDQGQDRFSLPLTRGPPIGGADAPLSARAPPLSI